MARFLSSSCREAVTWSTVVPYIPQFIVDPVRYELLITDHLEGSLPYSFPTHCDCKEALHQNNHHLFCCERNWPHDRVKRQLRDFCRSAGIQATEEPGHVCKGARPDLLAPDLSPDGKELLLDFTTGDAGNITHLNRGSWKEYFVATECRETVKNRHYAGTFNEEAYDFTPIAMETSGRWSRNMHRFFDHVKRHAFRNRPQHHLRHSHWVQEWRQRISVVYANTKAACAQRTIRDLCSLGVDYVE